MKLNILVVYAKFVPATPSQKIVLSLLENYKPKANRNIRGMICDDISDCRAKNTVRGDEICWACKKEDN